MDESKISLDPYVCAFDHTKNCPIRTMFKLQPENLLGYCAICYINPTSKQGQRHEPITLSRQIPQILEIYMKLEKDERIPFLDAIKLLSDIQTQ